MKVFTIVLTLTLSSLSLLTHELRSQDRTKMSSAVEARMDSTRVMYKRDQAQIQEKNDADKITSLKNSKRQSKEKAREARRVERQADDALRQSKYALRSERKAQKARKDADAQSKKAIRAQEKSDDN